MAIKNYEHSRRFTWPNVAMEYAKLFDIVYVYKKAVRKQKKEGIALEVAMHST
jgi:hypothetical protein